MQFGESFHMASRVIERRVNRDTCATETRLSFDYLDLIPITSMRAHSQRTGKYPTGSDMTKLEIGIVELDSFIRMIGLRWNACFVPELTQLSPAISTLHLALVQR